MPQNRNSMVLRICGLAGVAVERPASHPGVMHTATSTDVDQSYTHNLLLQQCAEPVGAAALLREVAATMEFDAGAVLICAGYHCSTTSALVDASVLSHGLSFRGDQEGVARLVAAHGSSGFAAGELHIELITKGLLGAHPHLELPQLRCREAFVASRTTLVARL